VDGCHHAFQCLVEQVASLLRVSVGKQLHGAFQVGEEDGDLLALVLQGTFRGQNLLGQGARGVAQTCMKARGQRWGGRGSGSRGKSGPHSP
jgi:hypothetical protein